MTTETLKKPSFYELLPNGKMAFYIDASMIKDFSLCEAYFYLRHVKVLRQKSVKKGIKPFAMAIGSWWSSVMEDFYNALRDGKDLTPDNIQTIAMTQWVLNSIDECALQEPEAYKSFGDLAGAILMLQEYYQSQYLTDKQSWKIVGVEEGFGLKKEVCLGETSKVVVYWIGKPDLVVVENGRLTPVDSKTVSRIDGYTIGKYKPSSQMTGYVYACEQIAQKLGYSVRCDRAVVNICSRSRPSDKPRSGKVRPRFIRAYPNFSREEIGEWRRQTIIKCERIAHCLRTNEWAWSETSCSNMFMRDCDYKKLHSITPSARDIVLFADFEEGIPWKPYEV